MFYIFILRAPCSLHCLRWVSPEADPKRKVEGTWFLREGIPENTGMTVKKWDMEREKANLSALSRFTWAHGACPTGVFWEPSQSSPHLKGEEGRTTTLDGWGYPLLSGHFSALPRPIKPQALLQVLAVGILSTRWIWARYQQQLSHPLMQVT